MISQHLLIIQNRCAGELARLTRTKNPGLRRDASVWIATQQADGGWRDINLAEAEHDGAHIKAFLNRVMLLAADYYSHRHQDSLRTALRALWFWYREPRLNWNWWWNEIGRQRYLGPAALMIGHALPDGLLEKIIADLPDRAGMTGANLADLANGVVMRGLLENSTELFQSGIDAMAETIVITDKEGIQADFSYHQHGPQIYNGGYGESFINGVLMWVYLTRGTPFAVSPQKQRLLVDYFIHGTMWMNRSGRFDYNVCGRAISKPSLEQPCSREVIACQARWLKELAPDQAGLLQAYLDHLEGDVHPYLGSRVYHCSDYAVQIGRDHMITIKANSRRTKPIETGNQENLLGYWLGFGSMNLARHGREYHDLFPVWDWRRIPGVTCPQVAMPTVEWGQIEQQTSWCGGVTAPGCSVLTFELDCQQTRGLKSWFLLGELVVALGAGISSSHPEPVATTLNQCRLNGTVLVNGRRRENGKSELGPGDWLHHDGFGYLLLGDSRAELTTGTRKGCWQRINAHLDGEPVEEEVMQLCIEHGSQPQDQDYQYAILTGVTSAEMRKQVESLNLEVLSNTSRVQAVRCQNSLAAVFHQPGSLDCGDGRTLWASRPCVITLQGHIACVATPDGAAALQIGITGSAPVWLNTPERGATATVKLTKEQITA